MALDMSEGRIHIGDLRPADIALLKDVAEAAAEGAVRKTLVAMGLDPEKPFDAQKDMMWLRATRERCEGAGGKALFTVVSLLVVAGVAAFWAGFKTYLK